jgi:hypothetical protein
MAVRSAALAFAASIPYTALYEIAADLIDDQL